MYRIKKMIARRCFHTFFKKSSGPTKLGRWSLTDSNKDLMDVKVDQANHDSCGGPLCTTVPLRGKNTFSSPVDAECPEFLLQVHTLSSFHTKFDDKKK